MRMEVDYYVNVLKKDRNFVEVFVYIFGMQHDVVVELNLRVKSVVVCDQMLVI
jgi:hypothetical protein